MRLRDKVVVITGSSSGMGRRIARRFAEEGARVVVSGLHDENGHLTVDRIVSAGGTASYVHCNIMHEKDIRRLVHTAVEAYGGLDILVNNAGVEEQHPFLEMPLEVWNNVIAVNLTGVWLCTQIAARHMVERKRGGRIINISSVHEDMAMPTNAPYCAAKGGVRMLMRTVAVELAPYAITGHRLLRGDLWIPARDSGRSGARPAGGPYGTGGGVDLEPALSELQSETRP